MASWEVLQPAWSFTTQYSEIELASTSLLSWGAPAGGITGYSPKDVLHNMHQCYDLAPFLFLAGSSPVSEG
jgi:hypothetical protein